jgi:DNA-binding MarR family transcriptional regulator
MAFDLPLGYLVKRAQSQIRRSMDAALAVYDLSMAQYVVLYHLAHEPGLSNAALARRAFVTPQTMIRIVGGLIDSGYVERHDDPVNQRRQLCTLTSTGQFRAESTEAIAADIDRKMVEGLDAEEVAVLRALLARCIANLEE